MEGQDQVIDNGSLVSRSDFMDCCGKETDTTVCYSERDLVSFGKYLLSEERKQRFSATGDISDMPLSERLSLVWDADVANWKFDQVQKSKELLDGKENK